jgi:hypothetical protein
MYKNKYILPFSSVNGRKYRMVIQEDNFTEKYDVITGDKHPIIIDYPSTEKFEPIQTSGAIINLLSSSDRQFIDLYSSDKLKYRVFLQQSDDDSGDNLSYTITIWRGYLNTEMYSEDFSRLKNYIVTFTANDGFNILNRIPFIDDNGDNYSGSTSHFETILNILNKLNLEYNSINISLSTSISGVTFEEYETLLHHTFTRNDNWYNEDNEPESCKKVIDEILRPFGAIIQQINGDYYILDYNSINKTSGTLFKTYSNTGVYVGENILNLKVDVSTIGIYRTGLQFNYNSGINKQVIKYNQYNKKELYNIKLTPENISDLYTTSTYLSGGDYEWKEYKYTTHTDLERYDNVRPVYFVKNEGIGEKAKSNSDTYLWLPPSNDADFVTSAFKFKSINEVVNSSDNYYLKITGKAYIQVSERIAGNSQLSTNKDVVSASVSLKVKVGEYTYNNDRVFCGVYNDDKISSIADKWLDLRTDFQRWQTDIDNTKTSNFILLPLKNHSGIIDLEVMQWYAVRDKNLYSNNLARALRLKDIKLSISDIDGNDIKDIDLEYVGTLDENWINSGKAIKTYIGCNVDAVPTQRGAIVNSNNENILNFNRGGKNGYTLEELLLNSIMSNFDSEKINLNLSLNLPYNNITYNGLKILTYNNQIPNKYFFQHGKKIDYANGSVDINMVEYDEDKLIFD